MYQQAIQSKPVSASTFGTRLRALLLRKIWLPRSVYAALPGLYIFLGVYAIAAALYLHHWSWIVPYLALLGICCLHVGAALVSMRLRRHRLPPRAANLPE